MAGATGLLAGGDRAKEACPRARGGARHGGAPGLGRGVDRGAWGWFDAKNEGGGRCDLVGWNGSGGIPRRMWERRSGGGAMGSMGQVS